MPKDFLTDLLERKYPDLLEKENSVQKEKSIELLNLRLDNDFSVEEFSRFLGLSIKDYLDFEFGSLKYSIDEYESLISNANNLVGFDDIFEWDAKIQEEYEFLKLFNMLRLDSNQENRYFDRSFYRATVNINQKIRNTDHKKDERLLEKSSSNYFKATVEKTTDKDTNSIWSSLRPRYQKRSYQIVW